MGTDKGVQFPCYDIGGSGAQRRSLKLIYEVRKMKKSELQEIADKLADTYGNERHFEIIKAEKSGLYWNLTIAAVTDTAAENDEGAANESN